MNREKMDEYLENIISEKTQTFEIPNPSGKLYKDANKLGLTVARDHKAKDTFYVSINNDKDRKTLLKWMLKNGWDKVDIRDGYDEEFGDLL